MWVEIINKTPFFNDKPGAIPDVVHYLMPSYILQLPHLTCWLPITAITPRRARLFVPSAAARKSTCRTPPSSYRIAQRTRAHFYPQHWILCHLDLY